MFKEYRIVSGEFYKQTAMVEAYLADGWHLVGGVSVLAGEYELLYFQAMTR